MRLFSRCSISVHRRIYILFSLTGLCLAIHYHTVVKTNSLSEKEVSKKCKNVCSNVPSVKGHSLELTIGLIILTTPFHFLTLFYL